jgi:predicted porin
MKSTFKPLTYALIGSGYLLCGLANAQSSVDLYGVVDAWAGAQRALGNETTGTVGSGGLTSPFWGLRGSEDLGDGNYVIFKLESFFKSNTGVYGRYAGDTFFSRNAWVGLRGDWGSVAAGLISPPLYFSTIQFNPFYDSFTFSPIVLHTYLGKSGQQGVADGGEWINSLQYTAPNVEGFTGKAIYGFGDDAGHDGENKTSGQISYTDGTLAATAVWERITFDMTPGDLAAVIPGMSAQSAGSINLSYDVGFAKGYAQYMHVFDTVSTGNVNINTGQLGVSIPLGNGKVLASDAYSRSNGIESMVRNTWAIGYDYPLSRRTDIYTAILDDHATRLSSGYTVGGGIRTEF